MKKDENITTAEIQTPWALDTTEIFSILNTRKEGLSEQEARKRQKIYGLNEIIKEKKKSLIFKYLSYFLNPLIILLVVVAILSYFLDNQTSAIIIFSLVIISVTFTFYQEKNASDAAEKLKKMIRNTAAVWRDGIKKEIPIKYLVPGDIISLSAGDMIPADCRIISSKDFFVNQSCITGESIPAEKTNCICDKKTPIDEQKNMIYFGSSVEIGSAEAVVINTGQNTMIGKISKGITAKKPETDFDRGIREYTNLMIKFVIVLVAIIFLINSFLKQDLLSALLFALAVAVGLTPEMLPAIVTTNLAKGALEMSKKGVIVKYIPSIQNFGAMDVLCTDKTGTLTEDKITLVKYVDYNGEESEKVLSLAYVVSYYQTGLISSFDKAILVKGAIPGSQMVSKYNKEDEIPFDFIRKRMSVVVGNNGEHIIITKGAVESVLEICTKYLDSETQKELENKALKNIEDVYKKLSEDGYRVIALAMKNINEKKSFYQTKDEEKLCFVGLLAFYDPPKKTAKKSLIELQKRNIEIKIISGDNEYVNLKIAKEVGLKIKGIVNGKELENMTDESLSIVVEQNNIFVRISPIQKQRIIQALKRNGHVVGYLGDGINDALALKTADVGISVNSAVDIAKESADIIMVRKSLHVLYDGVDQGRKTFSNIVKYLKMGSSSNFGNMFSVVGASIFLPYLPMKPIQLLLNNFLYDLSQLGIPTDNVDREEIEKPAKWEIEKIKKFMVFIGPISSLFDYLTFAILYIGFKASEAVFQTGWFIESILTQIMIIYVIRTKNPFESRPSNFLIFTTILIAIVALGIVFGPYKEIFEFTELPVLYVILVPLIVLTYLVLTYIIKDYLIKKGIL
ncbi:MAG: magnesium-translocating P-type ATPase [Candidatus Anstonellaceae archaeon]